MYSFRETDVKEAGAYGEKHGIFFQTEAWSRFRKLFRTSSFMGYDGENVCLSCIMYRLPIYCTPYSIGYITRGFVCDYSNRDLVREFTQYLKEYMKKHYVIYVIFDPYCDYKVDFNICGEDINEFFISLGYEKNNGIAMQPRTNYRLPLDTVSADRAAVKKEIYNAFAQRLKNDIKISLDRGVTVEKYHKTDLDKAISVFYRLLVETTAKKGFGHRDETYYRRFAEELKEYVTVYLYKYNSSADIKYTENIIRECRAHLDAIDAEIADENTTPQKRERLAPKRKEAVKQLDATEKRLVVAKGHTDDPYISAFFYIEAGDKSYNFYGANSEFLRDLRLTANYWDMISDCIDRGSVSTFNMGGTLKLNSNDIKEDKTYDLYQYKRQYGGELSEMPGEYYLVSNRKLFNFFNGKLNYFRRMVFRF